MVCDIVDYSWPARGEDLTEKPRQSIIGMSAPVNEAMNELREFLFQKVYDPSSVKEEARKAEKAVYLLYKYYMEHEENLPRECALNTNEPLARGVIDYIAGMTDQYALRAAEELGLLGI